MKEELLQFLEERNDGSFIPCSAKLRELLGNEDHHSIVSFLQIMIDDGLISTNSPISQIGSSSAGVKYDLNNVEVNLKLRPHGKEVLAEIKRRNRQDVLMEVQTDSVWNSNKMMKQVGESTIRLNDVIIPRFNRIQRNLSILTAIIAALSFLAIAFSAYYSSKSITSDDLRETNKNLENNTRILDSMLKSQKGIDLSLEKIAKDSFYIKHK
jgi:hypothetical protein